MRLQQALTKVPTNVQHFADLGVYKQLKKKTHLAKDALFPHLPPTEAEVRKVYKTTNNNTILPPVANAGNFSSAVVDLQKKMFPASAKQDFELGPHRVEKNTIRVIIFSSFKF